MSSCYLITLGLSVFIAYGIFGTDWGTVKETLEMHDFDKHNLFLLIIDLFFEAQLHFTFFNSCILLFTLINFSSKHLDVTNWAFS
jgi:hypothetical protein